MALRTDPGPGAVEEPSGSSFEATVERHDAALPVYLIVPAWVAEIFGRPGTFVVETRLDGQPIGRRSIKPWGDGRWFMELTKKHTERLSLRAGDAVKVEVRAAPEAPADLLARIDALRLTNRWAALSNADRRAASEAVFGALRPATREARIERTIAMLRRAAR
ncbi:MAG: YdeI/OmpD-associated family protein [Geminicoccaceae bacterium]|nr:YdeI/OmpD-associated family protein [Geminicoccaceae bacterium]